MCHSCWTWPLYCLGREMKQPTIACLRLILLICVFCLPLRLFCTGRLWSWLPLQYLAVSYHDSMYHGSIIMYGDGSGTLQLISGILSSSLPLKRLAIILECRGRLMRVGGTVTDRELPTPQPQGRRLTVTRQAGKFKPSNIMFLRDCQSTRP